MGKRRYARGGKWGNGGIWGGVETCGGSVVSTQGGGGDEAFSISNWDMGGYGRIGGEEGKKKRREEETERRT
jgi:hypothetical protein